MGDIARDTQVSSMLRMSLPLPCYFHQLAYVHTGQYADESHQLFAEEPPICIWRQSRNGEVCLLIAKHNALQRTRKCGHSAPGLLTVPCHFRLCFVQVVYSNSK